MDRSDAVMTLDAPGWSQDPAARLVMSVLNGDGPGPRALFVGGSVRDAVLGRAVGDIDIATLHTPDRVIDLMSAKGIKTVPTGIDHGTVTAVVDGRPFEITTLRRDVETFGRRATIAFTEDWRQDAERRDFTMNTLLADREGRVYDPLGQGLDDLKAGRVVFVGDPATRIAEDYLRILRFFRFHAAYGRGIPDAAALNACKAMAGHLSGLSRERVTAEFMRILMTEDPAGIVETMLSCDCTMDLVAPGYTTARLARLAGLQRLYDAPEVLTRLLVLAGTGPDRLEIVRSRLILAKRDWNRLEEIEKSANGLIATSQALVKKAIYLYGNDVILHALLFIASENAVPEDAIVTARTWQAPVFPLTGDDLKQAGILQGEELGRLLKEIENWWIKKDFQPNCAESLSYLQTLKNK